MRRRTDEEAARRSGRAGTAAAAAFVVTDVLHGEPWEPHFGSVDVLRGLWALFEAAEACLS